jgi:hypothetical protein
MKLANEILKLMEASYSGRGWEGRLKQIDSFMAWLYDKDILSKGEKKRKDIVFYRYYRYYNDGDFPRGLKGVSSSSTKEQIERALENSIEEFMRDILKKYLPKVDRSEFVYDEQIKKINYLIGISNDFNVHSLVKYWKKDVTDADVLSMITDLEKAYDKLDVNTGKTNTGMVYRRELMLKDKTWTKEMESQWKDIKASMIEISSKLKNIKTSIEKARGLKLL